MMRRALDQTCLCLGTGFWIGIVAPFAPGTFGSLPGVVLAICLSVLSAWWQAVVCVVLVFASIYICGRAEGMLKIVDDGRIVADEWMLFPIAVMGLPLLELPAWMMAVFFVVTRLVDIVKPPPAHGLQRLPGGWGIVLDDLVANLYSLAINWGIYTLALHVM